MTSIADALDSATQVVESEVTIWCISVALTTVFSSQRLRYYHAWRGELIRAHGKFWNGEANGICKEMVKICGLDTRATMIYHAQREEQFCNRIHTSYLPGPLHGSLACFRP